MEVILILLLIAGVGLGVAYICDPASVVSEEKAKKANAKGGCSKPVAIIVTLVLVLLLFGSCSSFLDDSSSSSSSSSEPKTAEEAAAQYYYDKDGHIRKKN